MVVLSRTEVKSWIKFSVTVEPWRVTDRTPSHMNLKRSWMHLEVKLRKSFSLKLVQVMQWGISESRVRLPSPPAAATSTSKPVFHQLMFLTTIPPSSVTTRLTITYGVHMDQSVLKQNHNPRGKPLTPVRRGNSMRNAAVMNAWGQGTWPCTAWKDSWRAWQHPSTPINLIPHHSLDII